MSTYLGAQYPTVFQVGIAFEAESGVVETEPAKYIVLGGEATPKPAKPSTKRRVSGNPDPVLPYRGPETFSMPLPMLPLVDGNGLGECFAALYGSDDCDQIGATSAYKHLMLRNDLIPTFTLWLHDAIQDEKIRMCGMDSVNIECTAEGDVKCDFEVKGADMEDCSDFGSPSYVDLAAARPQQLSAYQARLEMGEPGAGIRQAFESFKLSIKRNLVFGANKKSAEHPEGSGSPQMVVTGDVDSDFEVTFIDADAEELRRWRQGGDVNPSAVRMTDSPGLNKIRFTVYGNVICSGLNIEPDINNAGTTTATIAGTYGGGSTLTVWEIKIKQGTPDQYSYRKSTGGVWSEWSAFANITTGPDTLSDGATITFSSTTEGAEGDRFYAASHYRRYLRVYLPTMVFDDLPFERSDDFRKKTAKLYHTSGPSDDGSTKPQITLVNAETAAYIT